MNSYKHVVNFCAAVFHLVVLKGYRKEEERGQLYYMDIFSFYQPTAVQVQCFVGKRI